VAKVLVPVVLMPVNVLEELWDVHLLVYAMLQVAAENVCQGQACEKEQQQQGVPGSGGGIEFF